MNIVQAIYSVAHILGGVNDNTVRLIDETINARVALLRGILAREAAVSRTDAPQSATVTDTSLTAPSQMPLHAGYVLTGAVHRAIHERTKGFEHLSCAGRLLRIDRCLSDLRRVVNIALVNLLDTPYEFKDSRLPRKKRRVKKKNVARSLGPPAPPVQTLCDKQLPAAPRATYGLPTPRQTPVSDPSLLHHPTSPPPQRSRAGLRALPYHLLTNVIEKLDTLDDMEALVGALPTAAIARRRVRCIRLAACTVADESAAAIPLSPRGIFGQAPLLRELTLAGLLERDPDDVAPVPFALQRVTIDQAGWTEDDALYAIDALGLAIVRAVRLENARTAALRVLAARAGAITRLRCIFDGSGVDAELATAEGWVRAFTRLDGAPVPVVFQAGITPRLTYLALSNWLLPSWIAMLFAYAPTAIETFELVLDRRPCGKTAPSPDALASVLHYRGVGWAGCDQLRTLKLTASAGDVKVHERDVRGFMAYAFSRQVDVERHGVAYF